MSVTTDQSAPYAPASAILGLIERHRNKGLPAVVDADVLQRIGIQDSLIPRTLQALKVLELIQDNGSITETLEGLRLAPAAEYQQRLAEWLKRVYADALTYVDPATDDEITIRDAFRKYAPTGQQSRMVTLFIGLFTAAGVMAVRQRAASTKRTTGATVAVKPIKLPPARRVEPKPATNSHSVGAVATAGDLPAPLAGLLATLPNKSGCWTKERREEFVKTFGVVLDYTYKIDDQPQKESAPNKGADDDNE